MQNGYSENVTVDEGINPHTGIRTQFHFEGDSLITQKTFDAEPHLERARQMREGQEGQSWGEGKFVGHIPAAFYAKICVIKDTKERRAAIRDFFVQNPAFVGYTPYLKR
jgi:hypothetical protein